MSANSKLTAESFIKLVKQSKLVDSDLLTATWKDLQGGDRDLEDARALADELVRRNILTRWQADKLLQRKHKGFFLGKYRLLSHLGSGGMSAVYLAEHVLMRRRVAVKVLPQSQIDESSYLRRFHREAQAVASLDHRNIVRAYDVDQEGNVHFLVMEFVEGQNLDELVSEKGRLDYVPALEYVRQAAEGLHHAHRAGLVHRDIKPSNLLLNEKGIIKLLDLGLARFFDDKDDESLTIQHNEKVLGTADFLSPEQALDSHNVDIRSDIYSLGCTLYYLLTGHPPFPEGALAQRLLAHQTRPPAPIRDDRPDVPDSVIAIVDRMIAKNPEDRFQTARELADVLLQWLMANGGEAWAKMNPTVGTTPAAPRGGSSSAVLSDILPTAGSSSPRPQAVPGSTLAANPTSPAPDVPHDLSDTVWDEGQPAPEPELAAFLTRDPAPVQEAPLVARNEETKATPAVAAPKVEPGAARKAVKGVGSSKSGSADPPATERVRPSKSRATGDSQRPARDSVEARPPEETPRTEPGPRPPEPSRPSFNKAAKVASRSAGSGTDKSTTIPLADRGVLPANPAEWSPETLPQAGPAKVSTATSRRQLIAGVATLAALLVVTIGYLLVRNGDSRARPAVSNSGTTAKSNPDETGGARSNARRTPPLRRELTVGPGKEFPTIAAALVSTQESANSSRRAVQTIRVAGGQTYAERIVLDEKAARGIQIVAAEGPPPVLSPLGTDPIVVVRGGEAGVRNFRLEGFHLDARGRDVAVHLEDWTPGLKLTRLQIAGVNRTGILIDGAQSYSAENDRIVLQDVTVQNAGAEAIGVQFRKRVATPVHVRLQRCRFSGPLAAGVVVDSDVYDVEIVESVFFRAKTGVLLSGAGRSFRDLVLACNTFYENDRALVFTHMPGTESRGLGFYNNLFFKSQRDDAVVEKDFNAAALLSMSRTSPGGAGYNWTTRPMPDPSASEAFRSLFETVTGRFGADDVQFQSVDPASPEFLAPAAGSPHRDAGTLLDRRKFGTQIGAIRAR